MIMKIYYQREKDILIDICISDVGKHFLTDPGKQGVQSMGLHVCNSLMVLRLYWFHSDWLGKSIGLSSARCAVQCALGNLFSKMSQYLIQKIWVIYWANVLDMPQYASPLCSLYTPILYTELPNECIVQWCHLEFTFGTNTIIHKRNVII